MAKDAWTYTSTHPYIMLLCLVKYIFIVWRSSIMYRDNFTLTTIGE